MGVVGVRRLKVRHGRVVVVNPGSLGWLTAGLTLIGVYMIIGIPLSFFHLRHSGDVSGLMQFYALGGMAFVLPGLAIVFRLGVGQRTPVLTLLVDEEVDGGVLLAVVDARHELREFLVRPRTAGLCRAALGAPPPGERF